MIWTPVQKLSIGAGAALLVLSLFGIVAGASVSRLATQEAAVADANVAIATIDQLSAANAEVDRSGSEFVLTGSPEALEAFTAARSRIEDALDAIRRRTEDRPRQRTALDSLGPLIGERMSTLNAAIALRQREGPAPAIEHLRARPARVTRGGVQPLIQRMREEESRVLGDRTRLQQQHSNTAATVITVASVIGFLLAALAFTPMRPSVAARLTKRLTTPAGIPAIPEFAETVRDSGRAAADRLTRLQQVVHAIATSDSAEAAGDAVITRGLGGLATAAVIVARYVDGAWHVTARRSARASVGSALSPDLAKPLEDASRTREPVVIESRAERDRLYPELPSMSAAAEVALISIPMVRRGRVSGGIMLAFDSPYVFGDDERAYLATLGRVSAQ
ncbi:MAG TPA: CHASE3 domain-containing protein [Gemmatimonadaceae bacterium]|nr:CHASE3 domain-containing protein [Gemmatimonadaceae bacterium]